ncbi:SITS-binding protein-like [Ambystoma mexicanum]|uniref:SITS-binding protein-like n=1 Tax=Ambystoma mexicanum TaxID=8296 RepID=UPI0037E783BB
MPHTRATNPSPIPEVTWDNGQKEMYETWKGGVACLGVAIFFVMTIGIIYWQVVDQPNKNWVLKGSRSGILWERRTHSLLVQSPGEDRTFVEIGVGPFPDTELPFVRDACWLNKTEFCYTWDSSVELKISLEANVSGGAECYRIQWTPLRCQVKLKDCFSMVNISWYGGASLGAPHWPFNNVTMELQPFIISDLTRNPLGYGSVLERYFLGSTGVAVLLAEDVPVSISVDNNKHFCLENPSGSKVVPLQYTVCVSHSLLSVHQEMRSQFFQHERMLPNTDILRRPLWRHYGASDSAAKIERELRSFSNKLKRHNLGDGLISVNEHSTLLLSNMDHTRARKKRKSPREIAGLHSLIHHLQLSITLSPYLSVNSWQFLSFLEEGKEDFWLGLHSESNGYLAPLLTKWKGQFSVRLNVTCEAAVTWYLDTVSKLQKKLGAEYVTFEGGDSNTFTEQSVHPPASLEGDSYITYFAMIASKLGNSSILTAGTRSNHLPLFIQMAPLHSDWSYAGLKGIIPAVLHYSLLGYNFFIPDAVGGSLANEFLTDEELFIRWLQIVTFLPVISFQTPPWVCCDDWVLNLTRQYIKKHEDFVAPLIMKYAEEWRHSGNPIFRPLWMISPYDPVTFTIDDEFLIGDEMLIAPVTEQGRVQRDIYLPGDGCTWMDSNTAQVFDGGTLLRNYSASLMQVPVFLKVL